MHDNGSKGVSKSWLCAMHDQSIETKHNTKHHKANKKTNIKKNKQNRVFLLTRCVLPFVICISLMKYLSSYKCAQEIEFLLLKMCTRVI